MFRRSTGGGFWRGRKGERRQSAQRQYGSTEPSAHLTQGKGGSAAVAGLIGAKSLCTITVGGAPLRGGWNSGRKFKHVRYI